jgi:hypothetical protein
MIVSDRIYELMQNEKRSNDTPWSDWSRVAMLGYDRTETVLCRYRQKLIFSKHLSVFESERAIRPSSSPI